MEPHKVIPPSFKLAICLWHYLLCILFPIADVSMRKGVIVLKGASVLPKTILKRQHVIEISHKLRR